MTEHKNQNESIKLSRIVECSESNQASQVCSHCLLTSRFALSCIIRYMASSSLGKSNRKDYLCCVLLQNTFQNQETWQNQKTILQSHRCDMSDPISVQRQYAMVSWHRDKGLKVPVSSSQIIGILNIISVSTNKNCLFFCFSPAKLTHCSSMSGESGHCKVHVQALACNR